MGKLKIAIFSFIIIFIFYVFYSVINPVFFGLEKVKLDIGSSETNLQNHVKYITSFKKQRSHNNIKTLNKVADYIYKNFEKHKCDDISFQAYIVNGKEYKNIICRFKGKSKTKEKIVIGAHYDTHQKYDLNNLETGIFPGADDNASGVAGLLELTRLVGIKKNKLITGIEFVAYTLEEQPYFATKNMGSFMHAKSLKDSGANIKYMISLEMIGFFTDEPIQEYPIKLLNLIYPSKGNFIAIIGKLFDSNISSIKRKIIKNSNIDVWSLSAPIFITGVDFSDHRNYWLFGYNAYMVTDTAFYRNKSYHTSGDTIDTLNFKKMNEVVKGIYGLLFD